MKHINQYLNENSGSAVGQFKGFMNSLKDKGVKFELNSKEGFFKVWKDDKIIFEKTTTSFFRTAQLDGFAKNIAKLVGAEDHPFIKDINDSNERIKANIKEMNENSPTIIWNKFKDQLHKITGNKHYPVIPTDPKEFNKFKKEVDKTAELLSKYAEKINKSKS